MTQVEAAARAAKLREQIEQYRYEYYVLDVPSIADAAYDSLTVELRELEGEFPNLVTPDSPTQRVGAKPLEKFQSVAHDRPMLSLNDVFSWEEVEAWVRRMEKLAPASRQEYYAEIKMDGLAAAVIYEGGLMVQGLTRGDGYTGEDVTANLRTINSIPLRLRKSLKLPPEVYKGRLEVRGEVLMYKKVFASLNEQQTTAGKPLFANPRNTAAGTIRQLDPRLVAERRLDFHVYAIVTDVPGVNTHAAEHELAQELGFKIELHSKILKDLASVRSFLDHWAEARKQLPYGTDGVVLTLNDRPAFQHLGIVGKAPRGAVAYKFPAEQATTKVKDIQVSIGRTGAATPFAVLEPTLVAGSTIQMATLHNEGEVHRKDIRIGDTVIIQKAGDVIPEVVASLPKLRTGKEKVFKMPKNCPICGTELVKTDKEAVWRCPNYDCYALERGRIIHFGSKDAYDIEGLGEQTVDAMLESKLVADAADLYHLTIDDVVGMSRFAQKSAENLVKAIQASRRPSLDRWIYGLGIRHVGQQTAFDLAEHFGSENKFRTASISQLKQVPGIGDVVAEGTYAWLTNERHHKFLAKLDHAGITPIPVKKVAGPLSGQFFVITGTLDAGSRPEIEARIEVLGGKAQDSLTKETTYLVVGADPGASKLSKAQKLGTQVIDEAALLKLL